MKVDVTGSNSLLFANLPPASQVPGRTYRVSDVGPAPGILLTSNGTRYRPSGGRQVLAQRSANPVTVQNLAGDYAETIGPFPGGLVRSGMQIVVRVHAGVSGIGTGSRVVNFLVGPSTPIPVNSNTAVAGLVSNVSGAALRVQLSSVCDIANDTNGPHPKFAPGSFGAVAAVSLSDITCNFSLPWYAQIQLQSAAETATTITGATWSAGVATFTNTAHTLNTGDKTTVAGVTPSGYNGVYTGVTRIDANTWSGTLVSDPGAYTSGGTSSRISNAISQSYVLELVG